MANYSDIMVYLRSRSKLTQEEAAKKIGISRSSLANYEKGLRRPSFEIMEAIADLYNVNMDTIFGHTELPSSPASAPALPLSKEETELVGAWRKADEPIKGAVRKLLDIPAPEDQKEEAASSRSAV